MANIKKQSKRYQIIDSLLRDPIRHYNFKQLHEAVKKRLEDEGIFSGVSERTIFSDLNQMQKELPDGFGAPIDLNVDNCYFYTDPDFSITNCPLNKVDADKLADVLEVLRHFKDLPQFTDLEKIILKLDHKSGLKAKLNKPVVEFEISHVKGLNFLNRIAKSIKQSRTIKVTYKPFHKTESAVLDVSPQLLKEYNGRWFCYVTNIANELFVLALDRVVHLENTDTIYSEFDHQKLQDILKNTIGVTLPQNQKPVAVEFKVNAKRAPYIETKPLHFSQVIVKKKSYAVFKIKVIPNLELEALLLSYGKDLEVLKPLALRMKIKKQLEEGVKLYA